VGFLLRNRVPDVTNGARKIVSVCQTPGKWIVLFGFAVTPLKSLIRPKKNKEIQANFPGFIWFCWD
jgi:hypothetical protein